MGTMSDSLFCTTFWCSSFNSVFSIFYDNSPKVLANFLDPFLRCQMSLRVLGFHLWQKSLPEPGSLLQTTRGDSKVHSHCLGLPSPDSSFGTTPWFISSFLAHNIFQRLQGKGAREVKFWSCIEYIFILLGIL